MIFYQLKLIQASKIFFKPLTRPHTGQTFLLDLCISGFCINETSGAVCYWLPSFFVQLKENVFLWKISGALEIPKGSLLKQNLPNGMIKVVSLQLSGWRGICQNLLAASKEEKTFAPLSIEIISSAVGSTKCSHFTASFSLAIFLQNGNHRRTPFHWLCHLLYGAIFLHELLFHLLQYWYWNTPRSVSLLTEF